MTASIIIPQSGHSIDTLRTLIVNVGIAISDIYVVENNIDKDRLIKSGAIFIDESSIEKVMGEYERTLIIDKVSENLLRVDYVELNKNEVNGVFQVGDASFRLITAANETEVHQAPIGTEMTCQIKLTLNREKRFYGPGTAQLLKMIEKTQSVKAAAHTMNISYSKALQMIRTMERGLGFKVVEKKQGGAGGGESFLTEEGRKFASKYAKFNAEVGECVREIYKKYWD